MPKLELDTDEALVLFEIVSRFSDSGKLSIEFPGEKRALWNLCCVLEKELVEPFQPDYGKLLDAARISLGTTE